MEKTCRIIVVSDNHGAASPIEDLKHLYPDADYFLHLGDSELTASELQGYICVRGNNDWDSGFPNCRTVSACGHKILMCHGHRDMYTGHYERLADKAASMGCDIACFGHTHIYHDSVVNGVRMLNPGSISHNRDGSAPCYMELTIDEEGVHARRMNYKRQKKSGDYHRNEGRSFLDFLFGRKNI